MTDLGVGNYAHSSILLSGDAGQIPYQPRSICLCAVPSALSQLNLEIDQRFWVARPESSKGVENSQNPHPSPAGLWVCHPNS
jgi:hypothetical protein